MVPGVWSFLSEEQEELLVELHNFYRGQVSPSASAMLPLRWDPSLKLIAEGYAAKCIWNHNPDLEDTGENLFAGTGSLDLAAAMEKWFMEHLDYDFQNNSCDEDRCVDTIHRWCGLTHTEWAVPSISVTTWRVWTGKEHPSSSATTSQQGTMTT